MSIGQTAMRRWLAQYSTEQNGAGLYRQASLESTRGAVIETFPMGFLDEH
ncbi:MAG TPA: hypothetical protein VN089_11140 [Duganella sp.]|nr:hypothetical protein [Duganella sp.]